MTVHDLFSVLRRHPIIVMLVILLTAGAGIRLITEHPVYESRVVVNFSMPGDAGFGDFTFSVLVAAQITTESLNSAQGNSAVRALGGRATYEVVLANRGNEKFPVYDQPYVTLIVDSRDRAQTTATLDVLLRVLQAQLAGRQSDTGAQSQDFISAKAVTGSSTPVPQLPRRSRALGAIALAGLLALLALPLVADRRIEPGSFRRTIRRLIPEQE
jgi:hypothetical protein